MDEMIKSKKVRKHPLPGEKQFYAIVVRRLFVKSNEIPLSNDDDDVEDVISLSFKGLLWLKQMFRAS